MSWAVAGGAAHKEHQFNSLCVRPSTLQGYCGCPLGSFKVTFQISDTA